MRYLLLPALIGICGPAASGEDPVSTSTQPVPCVITDDMNDLNRCANLLARDWKSGDINSRAEALANFVTQLARNPQVHQAKRKANFWCRGIGPKEKKSFPVTLTVPQAIQRFPGHHGTNERELVSAVFLADNDEGCKESLYGHRALNKKGDDDWQRVAQFTTIETEPTSGAEEKKKPIGKWRSYSVSKKQGDDGAYVFRFDGEIEKGRLFLCQRDAGHTDDVAYISCEERSRLVAAVERKALTGISTIDDAMREFKAGNPEVRRAVGAPRVFTEGPAWMRCGDLGCCAMY